jgi:hypothetical protein
MDQQDAAFRSIQQGNHCAREEFSTSSRPALRAATSGGRPPAGSDTTVAGEPAPPSMAVVPITSR